MRGLLLFLSVAMIGCDDESDTKKRVSLIIFEGVTNGGYDRVNISRYVEEIDGARTEYPSMSVLTGSAALLIKSEHDHGLVFCANVDARMGNNVLHVADCCVEMIEGQSALCLATLK